MCSFSSYQVVANLHDSELLPSFPPSGTPKSNWCLPMKTRCTCVVQSLIDVYGLKPKLQPWFVIFRTIAHAFPVPTIPREGGEKIGSSEFARCFRTRIVGPGKSASIRFYQTPRIVLICKDCYVLYFVCLMLPTPTARLFVAWKP